MKDEFQSKKEKAKKAQAKANANGVVNPLEKSGRGLNLEDSAYQAPQFARQPNGGTITAGGRIRLSASATGVPLPQYRWRHNGSLINGATGNMLVIPNARVANSGTYSCEAYNVAGIVVSRMVSVTVKRKDMGDAKVEVTPEQIAVVPGTEFAFLAHLKNCDDLKVQYQWYKDGKRIRGATNPILRISRAKEKYVGSYKVVVRTAEGEVQSNRVTLELKSIPLPAGKDAKPKDLAEAIADAPIDFEAAPALETVEEEEAVGFFSFGNEPKSAKAATNPRLARLERQRDFLENLLNAATVVLTKPVAHVEAFDNDRKPIRKAS